MNGGSSEVIGRHNISELDKVGPNKTYEYIYIAKTFDTEKEANEFITMAKRKIGEGGVDDVSIVPSKDTQETTQISGWGLFKKTKTVKVPTSYTAYIKTNTESGIELAKQMINNRPQINNVNDYDPEVEKKQERITVF